MFERACHWACPWVLLFASVAWAEDRPKRVRLIKSFGANLTPWHGPASAFRTSLAQACGAPVEFVEVSLDLRLGNGELVGGALLDCLRTLFADSPPDLVVPLGCPAMLFAVERRAALFPGAPLLAITDDGQGLAACKAERRGIGLLSMQERVQQLGGELDVESAPGEGTEVVAWLPLTGAVPMTRGVSA